MTHQISPDRKTLTILFTEKERQNLRELGELIHQDATMHDCLEGLTCNSELEWISPADTGDLTSAPMLGILGDEQRDDATPGGYRGTKVSTGPGMIQPILERWAFMDYQVRSVLEDLRDTGKAVFVS